MFTIAARSLASSPSGISGNSRKAMSVTTMPSTASPRNSRRSLLTGSSCSNAYERWVSASLAQRGVAEPHPEDAVERLRARPSRARRSRATRPRWPGARRSTRSSRRPGAAASAGGTAGTRSTSAPAPSSSPCASRRGCGSAFSWDRHRAFLSVVVGRCRGPVRAPVNRLERGPPRVVRLGARALAEVAVAAAPLAQPEAVGPCRAARTASSSTTASRTIGSGSSVRSGSSA